MALINKKKANPWQAPPIIHYETFFVNKEKINEDIPPNNIRIDYHPTEGMTKSGLAYLKCSIHLKDNIKQKVHFDVTKENSQYFKIDDKVLWKTADKKEVRVNLKRRKLICFKEQVGDKKTFKLTQLSNKCDMEKELRIADLDIKLSFHVRQPLKDKEI